jgi:hypothetical protein
MAGRGISLDHAIRVVNNPVIVQVQDDGRTRYWAYLEEFGHYVRVVVEPDGEEILTTFIDGDFDGDFRP